MPKGRREPWLWLRWLIGEQVVVPNGRFEPWMWLLASPIFLRKEGL